MEFRCHRSNTSELLIIKMKTANVPKCLQRKMLRRKQVDSMEKESLRSDRRAPNRPWSPQWSKHGVPLMIKPSGLCFWYVHMWCFSLFPVFFDQQDLKIFIPLTCFELTGSKFSDAHQTSETKHNSINVTFIKAPLTLPHNSSASMAIALGST